MLRILILRFLESYFNHRWLYLLPTLMMVVAAGLYYFLTVPIYNAKGVFFVQEESILTSITSLRDSGYSWQTPAQNTVSELYELLQTDAFVRSVIERTAIEEDMDKGADIVDEIFKAVRKSVVLAPLGDNQIRIQAEHENPLVAQQMVNATFETFLLWKINADRSEGQVAATFLVQLVDDYKAELEKTRQALNDYLVLHPRPLRGDRPATEEVEIERLRSEVSQAETRYANALDRDEDARLALAQAENAIRQTYFLIDAPTVPTKPGTPLKETAVAMALFVVAGVLISVIAVVGGALLDRSVRFPIDVEYILHTNVITGIPDMTPRRRFWQRKRQFNPLIVSIVSEESMDEIAPVAETGPDQQPENGHTTDFSLSERQSEKTLDESEMEPTP